MKRRNFFALVLCILAVFNSSCGLLRPPDRQDGYLTAHFNSCGPIALERALNDYARKHNITLKRAYDRRSISIEIQDARGFINLAELVILLDKEAASITWPREIKERLKVRNIEIREIDSVDELEGEIAIILVRKKGSIDSYHWIAYPSNSIQHYGDKTIVSRLFVLIPGK